jgi:RimJ/RimL family protein N-acetyltransferase
MQNAEYRKYFPSTLTLETPRVKLRMMENNDYESLAPLTKTASLWNYFTRNLSAEMELKRWIDEALIEQKDGRRVPFVIFDKDEQMVCGCTSFGNISFYDRRIEIGWTWLGEQFQGTGINRQAKFALLCYAFDVLKMERVELKTDNVNERSKAALKKIGGKEEGVLRSHMLMHDGRRRDSIYFSFLRTEWDRVKRNYFVDLI